MKDVFIAGAGGFGRELVAWATDHPDCGREWRLAGFLDDNPEALAGYRYPLSVVGGIADYEPGKNELLLCGLGVPAVKERLCPELIRRGAVFLTLVHPRAVVGRNVELGAGTVVCPGAVLTSDIQAGELVLFNNLSSAGHDVRVGAYSTLSCHVDLTGYVEIGRGVMVGSHASILPKVTVGDGAFVGAGSVVLNPVGAGQHVFGSPARPFPAKR